MSQSSMAVLHIVSHCQSAANRDLLRHHAYLRLFDIQNTFHYTHVQVNMICEKLSRQN